MPRNTITLSADEYAAHQARVRRGAMLVSTPAQKPKPKRLRLKPPEGKEGDYLAAVRKALELHPAVEAVWRCNTGMAWGTDKRGKDYPVRFGIPGHTDLLAWLKPEYGQVLAFIEVKRPSKRNNLSDDQKDFHAAMCARGHIVMTVAYPDETIRLLDKALRAIRSA